MGGEGLKSSLQLLEHPGFSQNVVSVPPKVIKMFSSCFICQGRPALKCKLFICLFDSNREHNLQGENNALNGSLEIHVHATGC